MVISCSWSEAVQTCLAPPSLYTVKHNIYPSTRLFYNSFFATFFVSVPLGVFSPNKTAATTMAMPVAPML